MSRIVVVVVCDNPNPTTDGFVNRVRLVVSSLRERHEVVVVGIAPERSMLVDYVDVPLVDATGFIPLRSRVDRVVRTLQLRLGRLGFTRFEHRLEEAVGALSPDVILAMTYRRCDLVRAVRGIAPTVLFAEERFGRASGSRATKARAFIANALGSAQRDSARHLPGVVVLTPDEQAWARRRYESPIFVVPHGFDHAYWSQPVAPWRGAGPFDVLVVGNFQLERNSESLLSILDALDRQGWPDTLRFVVVSGTGYPPTLHARQGDRLELVGAVDDLRPHYAGSRATLVPAFRAFGSKNGILQGWGARCSVVTTTASAATAGATDGLDALIGTDPAEVATLLSTLEDFDLDQLVENGSARIAEAFSAAVHDEALNTLVAGVSAAPDERRG